MHKLQFILNSADGILLIVGKKISNVYIYIVLVQLVSCCPSNCLHHLSRELCVDRCQAWSADADEFATEFV